MVIIFIEIKKYAKYISVYIKVKIVETSKYDLSYTWYYIVIAIRELIIIFWTINEKVINYKVLDLVILYNFDIKFDFIRDHIKKLWIFLCGTIFGAGHAITRP
jgi:hypothetical protein